MNGDHTANARDALLALQFSVHKISYISQGFGGTNGTNVPFEADLSGDGKVDATDALKMLQIGVGKRQETVEFLEVEQFSSVAYPLSAETYIAPQILKTQEELEKANLPWEIQKELQAFSFDKQTLLIFSDALTAWAAPKAIQVALHNNRALVRYEYDGPLQPKQYALAIVIPNSVGEHLQTFHVQPSEFADDVEPMLYSFEYEVEAMIEIEYPAYEVIQTREEALKLALFMNLYNFTNEPMEQFLFYRAESGFFNHNQMVVWFDHGIHGGEAPRCKVQTIDVENKTAQVLLKGTLANDDAEDVRSTFRMRLLDFPKEIGRGCEEFVLVPASAPAGPLTPTDIAFEQEIFDHVGVGYFTGLHGYASGGAYIDSYTQWELYSQKITGNKLKPQEYGPGYFENNSLIVFQGHTKTSGPVKHTVTGVTCQEDEVTISVSEVEETGRYYDMEAYENFCVVELGEKLNTWLERIRFVVEYKLEQVDSSGNLVKVVKEETMEYTYYYDIDENQWV